LASSGDRRRIELSRSRLLVGYVVAVHALAIMVILAAPWAWGWRLTLLFAIAASFAHAWRQHVLGRAPHRIQALEYGQGDRWILRLGNGDVREARLTGFFAHPWLVVLYLRIETGGSHALLLPRGRAGSDQLRRLRCYLQIRGANRRGDAAQR